MSRVAFRVGDTSGWRVFACKGGQLTSSEQPGAPVVGPGDCNAAVEYASERVFEALMLETLSPAAALALGRLRVRGSLGAATASEELFERADALLRDRFRGFAAEIGSEASEAASAAQESRRRVRAAQEEQRRERVSARSDVARFFYRHAGTDQQVAALLLVLGSALYTCYCAACVQCSAAPLPAAACVGAPTQIVGACQLYLVSSVLWLAGSFVLVFASFPERVVSLASQASQDAKDGSTRITSLSPLQRYVTDSSALLGAWGLGLGAPTFLLGAVVQILGTAAAVGAVDWLGAVYLVAGLYIVLSTAMLVLGLLPASLAQNAGQGSTYLLDFLLPSADTRNALQRTVVMVPQSWHAPLRAHATDVVAGAWGFAGFMVACAVFGLIDAAVEPSLLADLFLVAQLPFAAGAVLLALATYPDAVNRATLWGPGTREAVLDEVYARALLAPDD